MCKTYQHPRHAVEGCFKDVDWKLLTIQRFVTKNESRSWHIKIVAKVRSDSLTIMITFNLYLHLNRQPMQFGETGFM